jgi:hypothetical protein
VLPFIAGLRRCPATRWEWKQEMEWKIPTPYHPCRRGVYTIFTSERFCNLRLHQTADTAAGEYIAVCVVNARFGLGLSEFVATIMSQSAKAAYSAKAPTKHVPNAVWHPINRKMVILASSNLRFHPTSLVLLPSDQESTSLPSTMRGHI